jgi:magnesium chelatase subunit D
MKGPPYPFPALVGLETLKMALLLAAVDGRLGVLVRGDKGAGKSTAARALAALLPGGAPFINLPVGATEDRLLGGLDVERAMKGQPALKPGLVRQAHGGVLYIDEVNLLPDHLADALLDVAASGVHVLEREGFSEAHDARFVLIGSMNPEEGSLRPQLLDRFALAVDVWAPSIAADRRCAIERRLQFDADPFAFAEEWRSAQDEIRAQVAEARNRLPSVRCPTPILDQVVVAIAERRIHSLRADLAVVRAGIALAAIENAAEVTDAHVAAVLPLALAHRTRVPFEPPSPPPPPPGPPPTSSPSTADPRASGAERVFAAREVQAPRLAAIAPSTHSPGAESARQGGGPGAVTHLRRAAQPSELDPRATMVHALTRTAGLVPGVEDLHERVRQPTTSTRYIFVVDSSGSQAANRRMTFVKGAVLALLESSARRQDEICVIAFRGNSATLLLAPTHSREDARRALAHLPTGGRTPLAQGLELAARYVTSQSLLVLVTDGRANVASQTDDARSDALAAASALSCPALVVDSETGPQRLGSARDIAEAMGGEHLLLDALELEPFLRLARRRAGTPDAH